MQSSPLDSTDLTWLAHLARALLGEAHAADDLVQETAVAALRAELPPAGRRRAWLATVARRLAARHYRGEARRARRERAGSPPVALPAASELVARAEIAEQVTGAAQRLPEPFRRTILLRFLEGLSPEEIARRDGKPADTVRWRVRRGLELLRQELVRSSDRDWSAWSVLLVPLARSGEGAGHAAAGATATFAGTVAALIAMKATMILALTVLGAAGLVVWISSTSDPTDQPLAEQRADVGEPPQPAAAKPRPETDSGGSLDRMPIATGAGAGESSDEASEKANAPPLAGRVVDEAGEPVAGATVYLVPSRLEDSAGVVQRTLTDRRGAFRLGDPAAARSLDLGVVANGYLRAAVAPVWPARARDELIVVLAAGRKLAGVVVDEFDRPVPGLELLCHTERAGIAHVSPSQMQLRSDRAVLARTASTYGQCRYRSDSNGVVDFGGLPPGEGLVVRSLDPGWTIQNPGVEADAAGYITWRAKRRLGVRLTVVDERTGQPIRSARATFRFELEFADGESLDTGQWVGRGRGSATFVLTPEILPGIDDRVVTRAVFYGEAGTRDSKVPWRADPIVDVRGASGVAEVRVQVDSFPGGGPAAAEPAMATLDLDVRYEDGSAFDRELSVEWRTRSDAGAVREGDERAERVAAGRYRVNVHAGEVELRVKDRTASGSLAPWTGTLRCESGRPTLTFATLPRGGAVTLPRPDGWRGTWYVRASWRPSSGEDWRGSWNYGTRKDDLVLAALRPAEWRFELRRDSDAAAVDFVRTVVLFEGVDVVVDR